MADYFPFTATQEIELAVRLIIAGALGIIVGYERERAGKPAGIRTLALVSIGAALFTIVSAWAFGSAADASRMAAGVVTGIGFIGGGVMLRSQNTILGVATAASIWSTAAIGVATGAGMYIIAVVATLLVFGVLRFVPSND